MRGGCLTVVLHPCGGVSACFLQVLGTRSRFAESAAHPDWGPGGKCCGRRAHPALATREKNCGSAPPIGHFSVARPGECDDGLRLKLLVSSLLALALTAVLLVGCGGGGTTPATVETSLRDYISGLNPQDGGTPFPVDAGPPRVKHNSCEDRHVTTKTGQVFTFYSATAKFPKGLALWSCVATFRNSLTLPLDVLVTGSKVVLVMSRASQGAPKQSPATVYEGGPKQPQP